MTFSVAVFDVHPGDRRQLERIFSKETQERKQLGDTLYTESFGSVDSLLIAPMKFDLFIVDGVLADEDPEGLLNIDIAARIREKGVFAPIVLYFSEGTALPASCDIPDVTMVQKPVTTGYIHELLDKWSQEKATRTPRYEIRGDKNTYYVTPREVMYAISAGNSVDVYLTEQRYLHVLEPMSYIFSMFEKDVSFIKVGRTALVNMHHIVAADDGGFRMSDDHRISCNIIEFMRLKNIWKRFTAL